MWCGGPRAPMCNLRALRERPVPERALCGTPADWVTHWKPSQIFFGPWSTGALLRRPQHRESSEPTRRRAPKNGQAVAVSAASLGARVTLRDGPKRVGKDGL